MQADGGLAAAGRALHGDEARGRLRDQLELARVDERRDRRAGGGRGGGRRSRRGRACRAWRAGGGGRQPERAAVAGVGAGDQRGGRAVAGDLQPRLPGGDLAPGARAQIAREGPLRRGDPAQIGVDDGDRAARQHLALDQPIAEALLVGVPFFVAVEEARHGGVAPVDDLHAAARLDEAARADQHVAPLAVLFEAQVAEVGRLAIDRRRVPLAALARQRLDPVHLLEDRSLVLGLRLGQRVAQLDERARVVDLDAALAGGAGVQLAQDHRRGAASPHGRSAARRRRHRRSRISPASSFGGPGPARGRSA